MVSRPFMNSYKEEERKKNGNYLNNKKKGQKCSNLVCIHTCENYKDEENQKSIARKNI
jgi:hypothetical protein